MENVAIHGMGGNDAYMVVPKYKKISKINEVTLEEKFRISARPCNILYVISFI